MNMNRKTKCFYNIIFLLENNIEKYKNYYLRNIPSEDIEFWKLIK